MRNWVLACLLVAACSTFATAQMDQTVFAIPKSEIYAGFAWQHAGLDGASQATQTVVTQSSASLKGFTIGYAQYFIKNIGIAAEISHTSNGALDSRGISYARTSYLGGPTVRLHRYGFFSPSLHVLAGVDHATFRVPNFPAVLTFSDTDIAVLGGGTVDGNLSAHLAVRLAQVDYLYTNHYGQSQSSFRYSGGLVVRF